MKRVMYGMLLAFVVWLLFFTIWFTASSLADWRWADPTFKTKRVKPVCDSYQCFVAARVQSKANHKARRKHYHARKRNEWRTWTSLYIPDCTWYGESGETAEYARVRYTIFNSEGSGARGKFQFMPRTYASVAKYRDWSPLDQEIAARREYWRHGTAPWTNC